MCDVKADVVAKPKKSVIRRWTCGTCGIYDAVNAECDDCYDFDVVKEV